MNEIALRLSGLAVALTCALSVAGCASDNETTETGAGDETVSSLAAVVSKVVVRGELCNDKTLGPEGSYCQAYFPDVVKDPKGGDEGLLMVYRWSSAHAKMPSELRMMRSRNGGENWEKATPFIVAKYGNFDYRDPSLTALRSGRLLLSYFISTGDSTGKVVQTQVKYRDPADVAFSAPVQVFSSTMRDNVPATSAKIAELSNGQLLIPLYGTPDGSQEHVAVVVASTDGGKTWDGRLTGHQKTIASTPGVYYQEPAVTEIAPGHVRAIIRVTENGKSGMAVQTDSYNGDYMTNWGTPWSLGKGMHGPELLRIPGTNLVSYLWSQPNSVDNWSPRRTMIAVRRPDVSWPSTNVNVLYDPKTTWDSGYSGTVALDSQRLVSAVYDTALKALIVLRYNVADVD